MSAVVDLQSYLASQGYVDGSSGWTSYRNALRDVPDKIVVFTEDGGPAPEMVAASGIGSDASQWEDVQIRTRGEPGEIDVARSKARAIATALHALTATALGSSTYEAVRALTSAPVFIGSDENDRPEFTQSFRLMSQAPTPA